MPYPLDQKAMKPVMQHHPVSTDLFVGTAVGVLAVQVPWQALLHRWGIVDHPSRRSAHVQPVVRGAGLAVAALMVGVSWFVDVPQRSGGSILAMAAASACFSLLGFADDVRSLPASIRLGLSVPLAAGVVWSTGVGLPSMASGLAVGIAFVVATVQATNFMDGENGLISLHAVVTGIFFWWLGWHQELPTVEIGGCMLTGAMLGFLPFNYPRARAFLGDSGSYFVGSFTAALVVAAVRAGVPWWLAAAPTALFALDTSTTLISRVIRRERLAEAHRMHVYQRLRDGGTPPARIGPWVAGATATVSVVASLAFANVLPGWISAVVAAAVLFAYVWSPHVVHGGMSSRHSAEIP